MLILTRHIGESIMLNDDIEITILGIDRSQIRIGFEAPKAVKILRKEIYEKQCEEQEDARY